MTQLVKTDIQIAGQPVWIEIQPHGNFNAEYYKRVVETILKSLVRDEVRQG